MDANGICGTSRKKFRELCLLSAEAILRGHDSQSLPFQNDWVWWMRDEFLAGIDSAAEINSFSSEGCLFNAFSNFYKNGTLQKAVNEKYESVLLWKKILTLSRHIVMNNKNDQEYIYVSSQYGLLLHQIIAEGWNIMAIGFAGDKNGKYDKANLASSIIRYDTYWQKFNSLRKKYLSSATLYKPYAFVYVGPSYHLKKGMDYSVNKYRDILFNSIR